MLLILMLPLALSLLCGVFIVPHMMLYSSPKKTQIFSDRGDALSDGPGIRISGISFFLITIISLIVGLASSYLLQSTTTIGLSVDAWVMPLLQLFVGCSLLFLIGLKDDLNGAGDFVKFLALLIGAVLLPCAGLWIDDLHGLFGIGQMSPWVGMPLTVLLVFFITFAFSLLDGIEGLSHGIGFLVLIAFFVIGILDGEILFSAIAASSLGVTAVLCLMTFGRKGSRLTMLGNSGAYVLGYIIATLTVSLWRISTEGAHPMMISIGVLILPLLDIVRVLGSRIRDGRNIEAPDRNQFNHKLLRTGLAPSLIPVAISLLMLMFVSVNLLGLYYGWNLTLLILLDVVLWVTMQYCLNWRIHAFEQSHHRAEWNKLYGKEAWDSHVPHEVMRHKIETYGTMGLPPHMQTGNPIEFIPDGMTGFGRSTKRLWDLLLSACCLLVFSPLFLLCYILIKMDDGGPAIYRQERIGRFGRPFWIYKFRSMRLDAEKDGPALSHANGDEDPRLTKIGRFLRQHHLDELPQLWNVFCGDMAFIGYRPERKFFIDQIMREDPRYAFLYQIRPGVTSYATLYNGYTDTMAKMLRRLELDLYYLRHRSWWFDCKVLFLTFTSIVFGKKF